MNRSINELAAIWRKSLGYTQWELAKKLGVYPQSISSFERGHTCPGHLVIAYLEAGMGVWLYGTEDTYDR